MYAPPNGSTIIQYHNQETDAGAITASIQISLVLRVLICVCLYSTVWFFRLVLRERERERNIDLLFFFVHSLVDSCMCPDGGLNPQSWHIGMTLLTN